MDSKAYKCALRATAALFAWVSTTAAVAGSPAPDMDGTEARPAAVAASSDFHASDIVVTATKREENIQDVGQSITALGSAALTERSISSLSDIAAAVPGLTFINAANSAPVFNLRGVGFYDTSLGSYPTTSVYLDQVPLPFPVLTMLTAFDLSRIEVLKGPQGILYGQNSTGGAINYVANRPTDELQAGAELTFGRFNHFIGSGHVSGPLSSNVRARVAVRGERSGPWQKSYTRDDENGRLNNVAGRLLIDVDPTETLRIQLNANGWIDRNEPVALQYFKFNLQPISNPPQAVRDYPFAPRNARAADWSEENGMYRDLRLGNFSARGDWEFTPGVILTSITSWIDFRQKGAFDRDGINFQSGGDLRFFRGSITSFYQELRVADDGTGPVRWIVGANYSRDKTFYRENLVFGESSGGNNFAGVNLGRGSVATESTENFADQRMRNYAVFANVDWDVTDQLTLKGGVRYTVAKRDADICNLDGTVTPGGGPANRNFPVGGPNRLFDFISTSFGSAALGTPSPFPAGLLYPQNQPGDCINLNDPDPRNPQANPARPFEPGLFSASLNEDNVSWRGSVDYKPTDNVLIYASVAKGYKAGGFGNLNAAINFQLRPVVQESILAYELGFKTQTADRALTVNGAVFHMDYRNKQLRTKDINLLFGIIDALNNVPKSHITGAELEIYARPVAGLSLGLIGTVLDSRVDDYTGINSLGVVADFKGTVIPFTPKWQLGANARYEAEVSNDLSMFVAGQVNYRSRTFAAIGGRLSGGPNLAPDFDINAFTTVDAQLGLRSRQGWRAMLWGKNITNAYYWTNVAASQDQLIRYVERPATYGVTLGFDF